MLQQTSPSLPEEDQNTAPLMNEFQEPLASLSMELGRISAEVQSINSAFQAQFAQALEEARQAARREFESRMQSELDHIRENIASSGAALQAEIDRVNAILQEVTGEIAVLLDDPGAQLSTIMRKKAEEGVMRAYLDGLNFSARLQRGDKPAPLDTTAAK